MPSVSSPLRIAIVLQDLEFGGAQRQALRIASSLDRSRFDVELWVLRSSGGFVEDALKLGVNIRFMSGDDSVGVRSLFNLWRNIKRFHPHTLVPFTVVPNIWCRLFGRLASIPVIIGTCRGGRSISLQKEKWLWKMANHHVCNADSLRDSLIHEVGVPSPRVSVIENGIDASLPEPEKMKDTPSESIRILCVGRLVEEKDHGTLIRAFAAIASMYSTVTLTIVGDGHLLEAHRQLARLLAVDDRISFCPGQADLTQFYLECDIFVLSSVTEASPNVILEAASYGRPVVATDVGGVSRLVEHNATGILVNSGAPKELALALSRLIDSASLRADMGRSGSEHVRKRFAMERMVAEYEEMISKLNAQCGER